MGSPGCPGAVVAAEAPAGAAQVLAWQRSPDLQSPRARHDSPGPPRSDSSTDGDVAAGPVAGGGAATGPAPRAAHAPPLQIRSPGQSRSFAQLFGAAACENSHTPLTQIRSPLQSLSERHAWATPGQSNTVVATTKAQAKATSARRCGAIPRQFVCVVCVIVVSSGAAPARAVPAPTVAEVGCRRRLRSGANCSRTVRIACVVAAKM